MIYGQTLQPSVSLSSLNTSSKTIYQLISSVDEVPGDRLPLFCHASDVADAHARWLFSNTASSQRYLLSGGAFNWAMAIEHIAQTRPDLKSRLPKGWEQAVAEKKDPKTSYATLDCKPAEKELGMTFKDWKKTLDDSLDSLLELENSKIWR